MKQFLYTILLWLVLASFSGAALKPNGLFSDNMVLQRDRPVPVWGSADPGKQVTVEFSGQSQTATADAGGQWRVQLDPMPAQVKPQELVLKSQNSNLKFSNVLVGDVWLCSGQSNMTYAMGSLKNDPLYADDLKTADFSLIRQAKVTQRTSEKPEADVEVKWTICSPETVEEFTAIGFYFARSLRKEVDVPVGLLHSSWPGTPAESWTSREALQSMPDLAGKANKQLEDLRSAPERSKLFPELNRAWEEKYGRKDPGISREWAAPDLNTADWKPYLSGTSWAKAGYPGGGIFWIRKEFDVSAEAAGKEFSLNFGKLSGAYETTWFNGEKLGSSGNEAPQFYSRYQSYKVPGRLVKEGRNVLALRIVSPVGDTPGMAREAHKIGLPVSGADPGYLFKMEAEFPPLTAEAKAERPSLPLSDAAQVSTTLYNGMIHPLAPFALKGALWYQGEANGSRAGAYRTLLPAMIIDWRKRWGQGDFPFLIQQLVNWKESGAEKTTWAELRDAQRWVADNVPGCGIGCGIDIGESDDVHPKNKRDAGQRLALVALAKVYGKDIVYSGPVFESLKKEGGTLRVAFTHAEGLKTKDGQPPRRFQIAGEDLKFFSAETKIEKNSVILSSPQVPNPTAVRYAWINDPVGVNLVNGSGLPAFPFRTDP